MGVELPPAWFNVVWGALFAATNFALFLLCYRLFGKSGLFAWVAVATVLANIQVGKTIELFGIVTTLGNTMYGTIFLATDLLHDRYGQSAARKAVHLGLFTLLATTATMQLALQFIPQASDLGQGPLAYIFGLLPRLAFASMTAYVVSQYLDVRLFARIRRRFPTREQFWIRSAGSTVLSQLVDSTLFCTIAFLGVYPFDVWLQILVSTIAIKMLITALSVPVVTYARGLRTAEDSPLDDVPSSRGPTL